MAEYAEHIRNLEHQISTLETQLQALRSELATARGSASPTSSRHDFPDLTRNLSREPSNPNPFLEGAIAGGLIEPYHTEILSALQQPISERPDEWPLGQDEYRRYGRQLIMPEVGLTGQLRLKKAKVLVVGVGGLGCPAAAYLAGAGVGTLGLVDGDDVEESNLHRQILHRGRTVGWKKVDSAIESLKELNPLVQYVPHATHLSSENSLGILSQYDLVLDCTDTPASRYLVSDSCVLLEKPLVSASALKTDGQLMVLNYPARPVGDIEGGPCYRCIFPKPPPAESVVSCGDGGILGPVVGVMGVLQSLEAIKVITAEEARKTAVETGSSLFKQPSSSNPSLLIFSGYSNPQFRSIKLRSRSPKCAACSSQATITPSALLSGSLDYIQFCGITNPVDLLTPSERISAHQYGETRKEISLNAQSHILIDVREKVQYDICHLFGSINIPFSRITALRGQLADHDTLDLIDELREYAGHEEDAPMLVVCRLGNDSQVAVRKFKEMGLDDGGKRWVGDIKGGLKAWRKEVDPSFPEY